MRWWYVKAIVLFIVLWLLINQGQGGAQEKRINSKNQQEKISLKEVLTRLEDRHNIHIVYDEKLIRGKTLSSSLPSYLNLSDELRAILGSFSLTYEIVGNKTIVIMPHPWNFNGKIKGKITNKHGKGIAGAQVIIENTYLGASADLNGEYLIPNVPSGNYILKTQVIGYYQRAAPVEVKANEVVTQNFSLVQDVIQMDEVVITATRNPLTKRESSVAITTKTIGQIDDIAPRNTADLLRVIPGFYVESSGGEVGGNLFARGLPADGSYYYVALLEDGMPVYDAPSLSFVNADILIRIDENIERMEAVRGGNSALFGSNAPGGVINFISKTGGNQLALTSKMTAGTGGLVRYDLNLNGPLGKDWRFSLGGFYRYDRGIRYPGFTASKGGQIKGNVTRLFKNGYIKLYGKFLRDSNTFYLPLPFQSGPAIKFVDGFPHNGTLTTVEGNLVQVPTPNGSHFTTHLEDGQKQIGGSIVVDMNINFSNNLSFQTTTRYMNINHHWNALVPFKLVKADEWAKSYVDQTPNAAGYDLFFTNHCNADGSHEPFNTENNLLCESGLWAVSKPLMNISNQLLIKKRFTYDQTEHKITLGSYLGYYTALDFWYWQNILTDVRNAPRFVDLNIKDSNGNTIRKVTENGFRNYGSMYMNANGSVIANSIFFGDDIKVNPKLRADIGARLEMNRIRQDTENTQSYDLNGFSDADDSVRWGNGTFKHSAVTYYDWAASVGINYTLNSNLSLYARGSRGYKMPTLDVFRGTDGTFHPKTEELIQYENGIKLGMESFGVNATLYFMQLKNFPSQDARIVNGKTVWVTDYVGESQSYGMELEAVAVPFKNFTLNLITTVQNHAYKNFEINREDYAGHWIQRIPKFIGEVIASYSWERITLHADYHYNGKRFANNANTIELPGFGVANFSASYEILIDQAQKITMTLHLLNAFNGTGLTEGNPRLDNSGAEQGTYYLARPILPRRFNFSLIYQF